MLGAQRKAAPKGRYKRQPSQEAACERDLAPKRLVKNYLAIQLASDQR